MNATLEQINSAGLRFIEFAPPMLIQSSVLILILLLTDFALRKKVRAVFRYWIWMLVLVKLVLPTSLSTPVSLGYFFGDQLAYVDRTETTTELAEIAPAIVSPMIDHPPIEVGSDTSAIVPMTPTIEPAVTKPTNPPVVPVTPLSWQGIVFLLWLVVVMAMGLLLLQRANFVRGLVAQSKEANGAMNDTLVHCCERMGVKRKIRLKVSANAVSPAVCGLFRPVILVPQNLTSSLNPSQLRAVLLHELAHIRRGDLWVNLAQTVLQIVYFYNPLLWLANCVIRRVREQAVDEMVLVAMGEKAQQYPQTLVNVAKLAFKRPALSLRLIGVVESKNALAGRIKHILNRPMPKKAKLGILGLLIIIITAAILLPMAAFKPGPPSLVIKGVVKDAQTGEPIAGARVFDDGYGPKPDWEQIKANERSEWGATTNSAGEYSFLTWPEHHSIKVEAPGYKSERQSLYDGHFVFNKKDEEIFDFALEPEKASESSEFKTKLPNGVTAKLPMAKAQEKDSEVGETGQVQSQFTATLPNGVTVELVCVFTGQSKEELTWWHPDGNIMEEREYTSYEDKINPRYIRHIDPWQFEYGYVLRFTPSDVSTMVDVTVGVQSRHRFPSEDGISVNIVESDDIQREKGLPQVGDIKVAAAYGPFKSLNKNRAMSETRIGLYTRSFLLDDGSTIMLSSIRPSHYQPKRELMIDTTVNANDVDINVLYESKDGNIRKARWDGTTGGPSLVSSFEKPKTMIQHTFRLQSIKQEDLKRIIVEYRRFKDITFKGVALKPGVKTNVQTGVKIESAGSKVPAEMVGTWFFDNPGGDDEQMAIFPDGRVVVLYSNGHKDQTNYVNGFIELAEYDGAKYKMDVEEKGTLVQYFDSGGSVLIGKRWKRLDPQPHTNLLRSLTGPDSSKTDMQVETGSVSNIEALIKSILPSNWFISRIENNSWPFYHEKGNGKTFYLARRGASYKKQQYSAVIWIMPVNYNGQVQSPLDTQATPAPKLICTTKYSQFYIQGFSQQLEKRLIAAILGTEDEKTWGKPVDGLQCRLRAIKSTWNLGEVPTLSLDLRNVGDNDIICAAITQNCEIEYDGQLYEWAGPTIVDILSFPLRPGKEYLNAVQIKISTSWATKKRMGVPLVLTPGRHIIRVRYRPEALAWFKSDPKKVPAISNLVEIEIPVEKPDVQIEVEKPQSLIFHGLDLTAVPHTTNSSKLPDLFEERPPGSKSYRIQEDVTVIYSGIDGTVYFIPGRNIFYVQHDKLGSSTLTYYGPFEGNPVQVLNLQPDVQLKFQPQAHEWKKAELEWLQHKKTKTGAKFILRVKPKQPLRFVVGLRNLKEADDHKVAYGGGIHMAPLLTANLYDLSGEVKVVGNRIKINYSLLNVDDPVPAITTIDADYPGIDTPFEIVFQEDLRHITGRYSTLWELRFSKDDSIIEKALCIIRFADQDDENAGRVLPSTYEIRELAELPSKTDVQVESVSVLSEATGRVVDVNGQGVSGATLEFYKYDTEKKSRKKVTTMSDKTGRFHIPVIRTGEHLSVWISAPGFAKRESVSVYPATDRPYSDGTYSTDNLIFKLKRLGIIEGQVIGPNGKSLVWAPLSLSTTVQYPNHGEWTSNHLRAITDKQGHFRMEDVPPGTHLLYYPWSGPSRGEVSSGRWRAFHGPDERWPSAPVKGVCAAKVIKLGDGRELRGIVIDLSKSTCAVEGEVHDTHGRVVADAMVSLYWVQSSGWSSVNGKGYPPVATDAEGRYRLQNLPPGDWHIKTWHDQVKQQSKPVPIELKPGRTIQQDLALSGQLELDATRTDVQVKGEEVEKKGNLVWGEEVNGLRAALEFVPEKGSYSMGERVEVRYYIQNVSDDDIQIVSTNWRQDIAFVKDDRGNDVEVYNTWFSGWPRFVRFILKHGETFVLESSGLGFGDADDPALVRDLGKEPPIGNFIRCEPNRYSIQYKLPLPDVKIQSHTDDKDNVPQPGDWKGILETGTRKLIITPKEVTDLKRFQLVLSQESMQNAVFKFAYKYRARICFEGINYEAIPELRTDQYLLTGTFSAPTIPEMLDSLTQMGPFTWEKFNHTYFVYPRKESLLRFRINIDARNTPLESVVRKILDQSPDGREFDIKMASDGPMPDAYPNRPLQHLWITESSAMYALSCALEQTGQGIIWALTEHQGGRRLSLHHLPQAQGNNVRVDVEER